MVTYDFIMLAILVGAVVWGLSKGMVWQIASVASLVASYIVSMQLREPVAQALGLDPPWGNLAAMLGLYLATSLGIWLVFGMLKKTLHKLELKDWDRQVGAGIGLLQGGVLCIIVTMFAVAMTKDENRQQIVASKSGFYITKAIHQLHGVMPQEVNDVVGPYIVRYNQRINGENPEWFAEVDGINPGANANTSSDGFNLRQQFQEFRSDVQNRIQNRVQGEVQNQANQFQNYVNEAIENPQAAQQNWQQNWQQHTGQYQQPQTNYYPPQMNIPAPQQQQGGGYFPQFNQPQQQAPYPMQNGQPYAPQYPGSYPQQQPYYGN